MPHDNRPSTPPQVAQVINSFIRALFSDILPPNMTLADSDDSDESWDETKSGGTTNVKETITRSRLPPLAQSTGPPIHFSGILGGTIATSDRDDPRLAPMSVGFPVSVHPLRIPNARIHYSSASTYSVIDFDFVRLSGLLHKMVPLREGVDKVTLRGILGGSAEISGYVDVLFDAFGYEFEQRCWVMDIGLPYEMQLGNDWADKYEVSYKIEGMSGGYRIVSADAKKVRKLEDVYAFR